MAKILAIETSCDETAVAISAEGKLLSSVVASQVKTHARFGGVMPEAASRLHAENILFVLDEALHKAEVKLEDIDAFAFTRGPGLVGALHVGMQAAKTLAMIYDKPLIAVHHLAGHVYAGKYVGELKYPLLAVIVSGGNTELVLMKGPLEFHVIGETLDDAVGECFDKVARTLGLSYPGGAAIDRLALEGRHAYDLPEPLKGKGLDLSYSGLKTAVINLVHNERARGREINVPDMCRSFEDVAIGAILKRARKAALAAGVRQLILAGGVSANSYLRARTEELFRGTGIEILIPPMWCTTDNAAMIVKAAEELYGRKIFVPLDVSVDPNWKIADCLVFR